MLQLIMFRQMLRIADYTLWAIDYGAHNMGIEHLEHFLLRQFRPRQAQQYLCN